jgi:WD40 repeat protein/class 3 adenylate cyclase
MLQIRLLGQFDIRLDGKRVMIPSRAGQSLLAYLALTAGTPHRREKLAGIFWPDTTDENARKNLRQELWRIRKAVSAQQSTEGDYLLADEFTLTFNREAGYWLDVSQMQRPDLDLQSLIANLSLYQGELLPGFYDEWITLERERIQTIFDARMDQLLEGLITAERWIAVQEWGERWLTLSSAREPAYRALMLASGVRGDMTKVASLYQRCTDELQEYLGVEPSAETRALYDGLLKGAKSPLRTSAAQPSGTITFLFTDIEGSTRLLEKMGDQYAVALGEHHEILRTAVQKWDGREVDTQGDAFFVTFTRAIDAVQCAAEAQRALAAHPWHQGENLRVRMGLHTGEPLIASTGYVGMDVHRAARIGDAGHGGQILLSQTTRELVIQDLPEGMTIQDLGEHRLKDMKYPSSIYQLVVDGLPADFAPIRTKFTGTESPTPGEAPFKGLQFFDEGDSDLFFGRETLTAKLIHRLRDAHFLSVIIGASGSGKSSLVRAGLVPALKKGGALINGMKPFDGSANWQVHIITPTAHPLEALAIELTRDSESVTAVATLVDDLSKDPRSLHFFLSRRIHPRDLSIPRHTLLVIDQFEELFTLCRDEFEREAFIDNLLTALTPPPLPLGEERKGESNITLIITLRADFYAHLAQYPELRDAVAQQQEYIGPMTADELRSAIEEPARSGHWEFEPGLVDLILRDVGDEPGALPLLSHALLETWKRRAGHRLTLKGYADAGGVHGAIAHSAESLYQNLSLNEQTIMRNILLRLTEFGEGTEDTRRRATFDELMSHTEDPDHVRTVLNTLAEARLVTLSEDTAEVAHEALIREWPKLREWLSQDREGIILHRHLTEASHEWELLERDAGSVYRGARLAQANEWSVLNPNALNTQERMFLDASNARTVHEEQEREEQRARELAAARELAETQRLSASRLRIRNRVITSVGSIAVILALLAGMFGVQSNQNAITAQNNAATAQVAKDNALHAQATSQAETNARATQQAIAEANFTRAESQRLAAEATNLINASGSSETAALLALRSLNLEYTPQGDAALLNAINLNYPLQVFTGHTGTVTQVAFSPDDQMILTGSADNTARLFDIETGQQLQIFSGHTDQLNDLAFSPDGKLVLTGSSDQTARLWDTATGREIWAFVGHTNIVITVAFSQDGKQILTGSEDSTMRLWDAQTGRELNQWFIEEPVSAFSPDGNFAVGYSEIDNANHLWDINALTKTHSFTYPGTIGRSNIEFSSDGKYLLAGYGLVIVLSDVTSGQELQVFKGHTDGVNKLAFSPDGKYVLSGSFDRTVRLWDIQTGQEVRRFSGHAGAVYSVAFSSHGQRILTGGDDGTVLLWDIKARPELPTFNGQNDMYGIAFSADGRQMATNVISNELRLWDVESGQTLWSAQGSGLALWALKFSPDGKYVLSGNMDGVTTLWDAKTGKEVREFTAQGLDEIYNLAFSPDGKTIVAGGFSFARNDTFVPMWEVETGKEILRFPLPLSPVYGISFSPDGKYVFTGGGDGVSYLWDAQTGTKLREFVGGGVGFSPDGKYAVTVKGSTGFVLDVQTGQEIRRFDGPADGIGFVVYSPDGKFVAATNWDGFVRLWDAQTGQELRRYLPPAPANIVAFSPDSQYLVSLSTDGIARFFDVDYRTTMAYLCSRLLRDFTDEERAQYGITDTTPTCPIP